MGKIEEICRTILAEGYVFGIRVAAKNYFVGAHGHLLAGQAGALPGNQRDHTRRKRKPVIYRPDRLAGFVAVQFVGAIFNLQENLVTRGNVHGAHHSGSVYSQARIRPIHLHKTDHFDIRNFDTQLFRQVIFHVHDRLREWLSHRRGRKRGESWLGERCRSWRRGCWPGFNRARRLSWLLTCALGQENGGNDDVEEHYDWFHSRIPFMLKTLLPEKSSPDDRLYFRVNPHITLRSV